MSNRESFLIIKRVEMDCQARGKKSDLSTTERGSATESACATNFGNTDTEVANVMY